MIYVEIPRDLSRVKTKLLFHLTKRQLICFGLAALIGVPFFFWLKQTGNASFASCGMILIMLPLFFLAMYERDGMPLEVWIRHWVRWRFLRPRIRIYKTNNFYDLLHQQGQLEKEVNAIVSSHTKPKKTAQRHPKADRKR